MSLNEVRSYIYEHPASILYTHELELLTKPKALPSFPLQHWYSLLFGIGAGGHTLFTLFIESRGIVRRDN